MATDRYEFPDVAEMNWLRRFFRAWKAWRNVRMYQDLALASLIAHRDEKTALLNLQHSAWWFRRMQTLRGVNDAVAKSAERPAVVTQNQP